LPGVGSIRAPARFAVLVLFALSVFTVFGARRTVALGIAGRVVVILLLPMILSLFTVLASR
jgi:hypothetical protein